MKSIPAKTQSPQRKKKQKRRTRLHFRLFTFSLRRLSNWSLEQGQPTGAGLGGALEVAIEHYLTGLAGSMQAAA
jgi:hypothetical protein